MSRGSLPPYRAHRPASGTPVARRFMVAPFISPHRSIVGGALARNDGQFEARLVEDVSASDAQACSGQLMNTEAAGGAARAACSFVHGTRLSQLRPDVGAIVGSIESGTRYQWGIGSSMALALGLITLGAESALGGGDCRLHTRIFDV